MPMLINIQPSSKTAAVLIFFLISILPSIRGGPIDPTREEEVLHLFGLFELSSCELARNGRLELQAAQLAVQIINQRKIIPGYRLKLFYNDTMCDPGRAIHAFLDAIHNKPKFYFILGPSDDEVAIEIARASQYWSILQISAGATSPSLSDRNHFRYFFRTVAPDHSHNDARAVLFKHYGWSHVGTLSENTESYALAMNELVRVLGKHHNITVVSSGSIGELKIKAHLQLLKEKDVRIIIGAFSAEFARKVFCYAYQIQFYGPRYIWFVPGSFSSNWWISRQQQEQSDCSNEQMEEAIDGYFSVTVATSDTSETIHDATVDMARKDFVNLLTYQSIGESYSSEALAFDAVLSLALAVKGSLKRSVRSDEQKGSMRSDDYNMTRIIPDEVLNTLSTLEFTGVSGPISFHGGDRVGDSEFRQLLNGELRTVAMYYADSERLSFNCSKCLPVSWRGLVKEPVDRRRILYGIESIDLHIFVGVTVVSCLGICLSLVFLCFNFRFRNHKFIKLSSPKLNNTTAIGCCLVYGSVIAFGLDYGLIKSQQHMKAVCQIRIFLLSSGFSVAFGSLFLKTFRVHRIFRKASRGVIKSKLLRDNQLLTAVVLLFSADVLFQLIWYLVDPIEVQLRRLPALHSQLDLDTVFIRDAEVCSSRYMGIIWLPVMYLCKGLMLLAGIFLTLETRNVKIPALNDSHAVGLSIYNVVIFSGIAFAINQLISEDQTLNYILSSSLCIVATTGALCFLFVPKLIVATKHMSKDPLLMGSGLTMESNTVRLATFDPREKYSRADFHNQVHKQDLLQRNDEISRLTNLLALPLTPYIKPSEAILNSLPEYFVDPDIIVKRQLAQHKLKPSHAFFKRPSLLPFREDEAERRDDEVPSTLMMETDQGEVTLIVQNSPVPAGHSGKAKFKKAMVKYKFINAASKKGSIRLTSEQSRHDSDVGLSVPTVVQDQTEESVSETVVMKSSTDQLFCLPHLNIY